MKKITMSFVTMLLLAACNDGGSGTPAGGVPGSSPGNNKEALSDWQSSLVGQEGHGGDAVVCFDIPVERALYKVTVGEQPPENTCPPPGPCAQKPVDEKMPDSNGRGSGIVWRMTDEGRKSIRSAKPLEQYLGERITSKKILIDQLNQMPVEEGYEKVLMPFTRLPAAFSKIKAIHQKLGWLSEDGISSEYGLIDVNDSGFVGENEIDKSHCKELQAVVRRDGQLWYDSDIVSHFDNAGKVLIQLHEEIYTWGKGQDEINGTYRPPAHETSVKTRRLILKVLDDVLEPQLLNENLKSLGFSIFYWENTFNSPTAVGYYMDTDTCIAEQQFLKNFFQGLSADRDFLLKTEGLFEKRYLTSSNSWVSLELRQNYPEVLSNMIALTAKGDTPTFWQEIHQLQAVFERPESCQGSF